MDPKITSALIAAATSLFVALVSFVANFLITRWQARLQVGSKINELTQAQFQAILTKRIEVYPELWRIAQAGLSDLERVAKLENPHWVEGANWTENAKWTPNEQWIQDFAQQLMDWHQDYGAFLSQASYSAFSKLRHQVIQIAIGCAQEKRPPTLAEFQRLDELYTKRIDGELPLSTCLKNDLGSYKTPVITVS